MKIKFQTPQHSHPRVLLHSQQRNIFLSSLIMSDRLPGVSSSPCTDWARSGKAFCIRWYREKWWISYTYQWKQSSFFCRSSLQQINETRRAASSIKEHLSTMIMMKNRQPGVPMNRHYPRLFHLIIHIHSLVFHTPLFMTCSHCNISLRLLLERADDVSTMQIDFISQFDYILLLSIPSDYHSAPIDDDLSTPLRSSSMKSSRARWGRSVRRLDSLFRSTIIHTTVPMYTHAFRKR